MAASTSIWTAESDIASEKPLENANNDYLSDYACPSDPRHDSSL